MFSVMAVPPLLRVERPVRRTATAYLRVDIELSAGGTGRRPVARVARPPTVATVAVTRRNALVDELARDRRREQPRSTLRADKPDNSVSAKSSRRSPRNQAERLLIL
jgi:hypothetical protein